MRTASMMAVLTIWLGACGEAVAQAGSIPPTGTKQGWERQHLGDADDDAGGQGVEPFPQGWQCLRNDGALGFNKADRANGGGWLIVDGQLLHLVNGNTKRLGPVSLSTE